jgi:hypothetical protein
MLATVDGTIDRVVGAGRLPCARICGHLRRKLEDVEAWMPAIAGTSLPPRELTRGRECGAASRAVRSRSA